MNQNIIVAGVGGQGSILVSRIIADAAIKVSEKAGQKLNVRVGETFGAAMRGGAVASHIRIGEVYGPLVDRGKADLVLALEPLESLRIGINYIQRDGTVILNSQPLPPVDVKTGSAKYPSFSETEEALKKLCDTVVSLDATNLAVKAGNARTLSVVMLGAAFASGNLVGDRNTVLEAVKDRVPSKTLEVNLKAFEMGEKAFCG